MKRFIVILGAVMASLSAIFVRWASAPAPVLAMYRMMFAVLLLLPSLLAHRQELRQLHRRELLLCLVSGMALGMHFTCYFASLRCTSIAAAVVLVDTEILFVALATVLLWKTKLSGGCWAAILLAFGGSVVVAMADTSSGSGALKGDLLALAGAVAVAVYTMIGAVCRRSVSTTVYTWLVYLAAGITVLFAAIVSGNPLTGYRPIDYGMALALAVFCTLLGHSIFSWGLKYLSPAFVSMVKLGEPVAAALWGLVLFAERPGWPVLLGGVFIILGLALYTLVSDNETKRPETARKESES